MYKKIILNTILFFSFNIFAIETNHDELYYGLYEINSQLKTPNEICIENKEINSTITNIEIDTSFVKCIFNNSDDNYKIINAKKFIYENKQIDVILVNDSDISEIKKDILSSVDDSLRAAGLSNLNINFLDSIKINLPNDNNQTYNSTSVFNSLNIEKYKKTGVDLIIISTDTNKNNNTEGDAAASFRIHDDSRISLINFFTLGDPKLIAHEFGHVLGLKHDSRTLYFLDNIRDDYELNNYKNGYIFTENVSSSIYNEYSLMAYTLRELCSKTKFSEQDKKDIGCDSINGINPQVKNFYTNKNSCIIDNYSKNIYLPCGSFYKDKGENKFYQEISNIISDNSRVILQTISKIAEQGKRDNENDPLFLDTQGNQNNGKFLLGTDVDDIISLLTTNENIAVTSSGSDTIKLGAGTDYIIIQNNGKGITTVENFGLEDFLILDYTAQNQIYTTREIGKSIEIETEELKVIINTSIEEIDSKNLSDEDKKNINKCEELLSKDNIRCKGTFLKKIKSSFDSSGAIQKISKITSEKEGFKYILTEKSNILSGNGTQGNDFIIGSGIINGNGGNDFIIGKDTSDTLSNTGGGSTHFEGSKGNDIITLTGSGDTIVYNAGDGQDTIYPQMKNLHNGFMDKIILNGVLSQKIERVNSSGIAGNTQSHLSVKIYFPDGGWLLIVDALKREKNGLSKEIDIINSDPWEVFIKSLLNFKGNETDEPFTTLEYYNMNVESNGGKDTLTLLNGAEGIFATRSQIPYYVDAGEGDDTINVKGTNFIRSLLTSTIVITGGGGTNNITGNSAYETYIVKGIDYINSNLGDDQAFIQYTYKLGTIEDYIQRIINDVKLYSGSSILNLPNYLVKNSNNGIASVSYVDSPSVATAKFKTQGYAEALSMYNTMSNSGGIYTRNQIIEEALTFRGTAGNDTYSGHNDFDNKYYGEAGNDRFVGGNGTDVKDYMEGGAGVDTLIGCSGINVLNGGNDGDTLMVYASGSGNCSGNQQQSVTTMVGGTGNDAMYGSIYQETYTVNDGDGNDTIIEFSSSVASNMNDKLIVNYTNPVIIRPYESNNIIIKSGDGTSSVTLRDFLFRDSNGVYTYGIETIEGIPYTTPAAVAEHITTYNGTEGPDTYRAILGYSNKLYGNGGNDRLIGANHSFKNLIDGGIGDDILFGCGLDNEIYGGEGSDTIHTYEASGSYYTACLGNSQPSVTTMVGGKGNDAMYGSIYQETYIVNDGDGNDTIIEVSSSVASNMNDKLIINYTNPVIIRPYESNNIIIKSGDGTSSVTLRDFLFRDSNGVYTYGIETIEGIPYTTPAAVAEHITTYNGTEGPDIYRAILGYSNKLYGNGGNDQLVGANHSFKNTIYGGLGEDRLVGCGSNNYLYGDDGHDNLLVFETYNSYANLIGCKGTQQPSVTTMEGGKGLDTYYGSIYEEIYIVNDGDGNDYINGGLNDTLVVNYSSYKISRFNENDVIITNGDKTSSVVIRNFLLRDPDGKYYYAVGNYIGLEFTNHLSIINHLTTYHGTELSDVYLPFDGYDSTLYGYGGNDQLLGANHSFKNTIYGGLGEDRLVGCGSNNYLYGDDGHDSMYVFAVYNSNANLAGCKGTQKPSVTTMEGGKGLDTYYGSIYEEIYIVNDGDGNDYINGGLNDTLVVNYSSYKISRFNENDVIITNGDKTSSVVIRNFLLRDPDGKYYYAVGNYIGLEFSNHLSIINHLTTYHGTELSDVYLPFDGYDSTLYGYGGNDQLLGANHSFKNTIYGGLGEDRLVGCGSNNYLYGDDGHDSMHVFATYNSYANLAGCKGNQQTSVTTMVGGIGNDTYYGSIYQEHIIYESGIDTLNLGNSGYNDSLECPSGFIAKKYNSSSIVLFYNSFNQIILNGGYNLNYSLKNICGRSLSSIIYEADLNSQQP